jgi:hypothetical protein
MNEALSLEQKCQLGRLAAKQFLAITESWQLTDDQRRIIAGAATRTTISTWKKKVQKYEELQLGRDTYERLICIVEIEKLLQEKAQQENLKTYSLLRQPVFELKKSSPLEHMLNGRVIDLYQTKVYLQKKSTELLGL